jgi:hypothetical protein
MGEIADAMINGEDCEMCGVFLDGQSPGYPRYCSLSCAQDRGAGIEQVVDMDEEDYE